MYVMYELFLLISFMIVFLFAFSHVFALLILFMVNEFKKFGKNMVNLSILLHKILQKIGKFCKM